MSPTRNCVEYCGLAARDKLLNVSAHAHHETWAPSVYFKPLTLNKNEKYARLWRWWWHNRFDTRQANKAHARGRERIYLVRPTALIDNSCPIHCFNCFHLASFIPSLLVYISVFAVCGHILCLGVACTRTVHIIDFDEFSSTGCGQYERVLSLIIANAFRKW